jgi:NAD(P)-dependent dehydrogenase (short-subunit alcohol dehydrogenase family)
MEFTTLDESTQAGRVDLSGAGMKPFGQTDLKAKRDDFNDRFWSAMLCIQRALPQLNEGGSVTLTSGTLTERPMAGIALAGSAGGALRSTTKSLALDLAPGIRLNTIAPGFIDTEIWNVSRRSRNIVARGSDIAHQHLPAQAKEGYFKQAEAKLPLKRVGKPDEVAEAVSVVSSYSLSSSLIS